MKKIFFVFFVCFSMSSFSQESDPSNVLFRMLMYDEFMDAREYHQQHSEEIVECIELFYKYKMHGSLNRPDSSAYYLERFIKEYPDAVLGDYSKIMFFTSLVNTYGEYDNYPKVIETYNLFEKWLNTSTPSADSVWREGIQPQIIRQRNIMEQVVQANVPKMKIENISGRKSSSIDMQADLLVNVGLEYNGVKGGLGLILEEDFLST